MQSIILLVVSLHIASGAIHSWKAYYTGTTGLTEFPEFVALNLIDDQLMGYFDSNTNRFKSQFKWMEDNLGKEYDDRQTNALQGHTASFKNNVRIAMERFNQTQGVHTSQLMYGCELDDDGNKRGYYQYGYDGEDFLSLDKSSRTWTAAVPQAFTTKIKWDSTKAHAEFQNNYLSNTCIEWLKKYVNYGNDTLDRKVSPQVSLWQKDPSSPVKCHATGFYPRGVTITWMKNGREHYEDVDLGELLPNEDGTFQKSSTISVTPDEWKKNQFSCVVEHQGKTIIIILTEKEIRTKSNGNSAPVSTTVVFAYVIASLVVIGAIGITGFMVYVRKNKSASKTSTVDSAKSLISSKTSTVDSDKSLISSDILNDDSTKSLTYPNSDPDPGYSSAPDNDSHSGSDSGSDNVSV